MPNSRDLTEQWYATTSNRARLEELLKDPVLTYALVILRIRASEPVPPIPHTQCDLTQYGAMMGFHRNGAFDILKNLEDLSKNPPRKPVDAPPFDHVAQDASIKKSSNA